MQKRFFLLVNIKLLVLKYITDFIKNYQLSPGCIQLQLYSNDAFPFFFSNKRCFTKRIFFVSNTLNMTYKNYTDSVAKRLIFSASD